MSKIGILFPHQLLEENILISTCETIYLIEEFLYFKQYNFHKQKIAFHRASMKFYEQFLKEKKNETVYIDAQNELFDIRKLIPYLKSIGVKEIEFVKTSDCWLEKRLIQFSEKNGISLKMHQSPLFINSIQDLTIYFSGKKRMFQTDFYKHQRISRNILVDNQSKPLGEKWTFDDDNRLKYPKGKSAPQFESPKMNDFYKEAFNYTLDYFPNNYGDLNEDFIYPCNFKDSKAFLHDFLNNRFKDFGAYEDALVEKEHILHHSVLSPLLNVGLISPQLVIDETLNYAAKNDIPLNSLEGFIRQIIGWREFIRAVYELKGTEERTKNFWSFKRKIPASFWTGTTGIEPIDGIIKKILKTGYCHHIERLMVLGNFMLLCEFDPDEVYRWFMELFIDSYDWVMVPNVYGMSQFADGGLMATKPYISGSNYLMKMSDYQKGEWQSVWDGLFWRFMHVHRDFFLQNPRLGMLVKTFDKMSPEKQNLHLNHANLFLDSISAE